MLNRGQIWWGETPEHGGRPYLVLTRDEAIPVLSRVMVAPVTRSVRNIPTELALGPDEGLRTTCAAAFDNVFPISKALLVRQLGTVDQARYGEMCAAMAAVMDC